MKKSKRKDLDKKLDRIITFVIVLVVLCRVLAACTASVTAVAFAVGIDYFKGAVLSEIGTHDIEDFDSYLPEFQIVADKYTEIYNDQKEKNSDLQSIYEVSYNSASCILTVKCNYNNSEFIMVDYKVTEEEILALKTVHNVFSNKCACGNGYIILIVHTGDMLRFFAMDRYIVYYTIDGRKPNITLTGARGNHIQRLSSNWFEGRSY